ncbi:ribonuclease H-like domain-containing protein [Tanacetum coccineum]
MSSPSHPTSNIEDAFSSNFLDYIPASPDYVLASLGKTYSSSLNNSFGLVPIASSTLSLFHDDPYMKVMHVYYAKESPIPPPTTLKILAIIVDETIVHWIDHNLGPFQKCFSEQISPSFSNYQQLIAIRNFEQESNEPLHLAWERFNESLNNCPEHKINEREQLQIFYQGLDIETRRKVDFKGPILRMTPAAGIKAITKLSRHLISWYKEGDLKNKDLNIVFGQINSFEQNMNNITEEVQMVQHKYKLPNEEKNSKPEETLRTFIEESRRKQKQNENLFCKIKKNYDKVFKKQASSIKTIELHLGRIADKIHGRGVGSLPSFTETNPKGLAHAITTRSGLNYNPPKNPLEEIRDIQNKTSENISTKEGSPDNKKIITKISPSPIPFPRRLKKEKEKEQFQKFFKNLQRLSINIPFIEALDKCLIVVLNEIPLKEKDPKSITIPCVIRQGGINKALADLGASIGLMPYSMFLRLNIGELKPMHMCIELADKSTQIPRGIAENVIVKIDRFIFLVDFVVLDMKEDNKIPIILGRPFLATAHAMIDVFNKKSISKLRTKQSLSTFKNP